MARNVGSRRQRQAGRALHAYLRHEVTSVEDLQSPPPHLTAKLTIQHQGKTVNSQGDVPGHRKGKDDVRGAQR